MVVKKILEENNITVTDVRVEVLNILKKSKYLMPASNILLKSDNKFDRVTLFRTLQLFVKSDILHRVSDSAGLVYYGFKNQDKGDVIFFKCINCNRVEVLTDVSFPPIKLNKKYTAEEFNFLIQGNCKNC